MGWLKMWTKSLKRPKNFFVVAGEKRKEGEGGEPNK